MNTWINGQFYWAASAHFIKAQDVRPR